jgi:hypothetical protein
MGTAICYVAPCSLVKVDRLLIGAYFIREMEAVRTSETSVYFHETTRRYTPERYHLYTRRRENLKYHNSKKVRQVYSLEICVSNLILCNKVQEIIFYSRLATGASVLSFAIVKCGVLFEVRTKFLNNI